MQIFLRNWYAKFFEELAKTSHLRVISPFVREQLVRKLGEKFDLKNFELITRFKLADFALNISSLDALEFCVESGSKVFGIKNLHSKVYLFDDRTAIVSSANLTNNGLINNFECGVFIDDSRIVRELGEYFGSLRSIAQEALSLQQIEVWRSRLESVSIPANTTGPLPDFGATFAPFEANHQRYFVKFFGSDDLRAPLNRRTTEEIDRTLCHYACTFSKAKRPRKIGDGDIVYLSRMTHSPNDYAIFGRATAIRHVDGRDEATQEEIQQRPFKKDFPIYLRVTNPQFINGSLADGILLYDLLNELSHESLASTRRNFAKRKGNTDPRRSVNQQAYVELTDVGAEWLERRFEDALSIHGSVSQKFLDALPGPAIEIE